MSMLAAPFFFATNHTAALIREPTRDNNLPRHRRTRLRQERPSRRGHVHVHTSSSSSWPSTSSSSKVTTNLHKLFPAGTGFRVVGGLHVGAKQALVLAATLVVLPTTWLSNTRPPAARWPPLPSSRASCGSPCLMGLGSMSVAELSSGPSAVSLYSFCLGGHPVFPMIYNGMKDRKKFPMVNKSRSQPLINYKKTHSSLQR